MKQATEFVPGKCYCYNEKQIYRPCQGMIFRCISNGLRTKLGLHLQNTLVAEVISCPSGKWPLGPMLDAHWGHPEQFYELEERDGEVIIETESGI